MFDDELATVRRHIEGSAKRIARQEEIIALLTSIGADTTLSEQVLDTIRVAQAQHSQHLRRLQSR